jgi:hypothetical protein
MEWYEDIYYPIVDVDELLIVEGELPGTAWTIRSPDERLRNTTRYVLPWGDYIY